MQNYSHSFPLRNGQKRKERMAEAQKNYKSQLIAEIELLPDEFLREIIDFAAFLKERYKNELEEDVVFIKQRYEEGKREKVEGITIPAEEVFAEARE